MKKGGTTRESSLVVFDNQGFFYLLEMNNMFQLRINGIPQGCQSAGSAESGKNSA